MVTIELQLISFAVVVTLIHKAGDVNITSFLMPYIFQKYRWRVFLLSHFINILLEVFLKPLVLFIPKVILVVDNYAKPIRVSGLLNEGLNCFFELAVTVGGQADKYTPIVGNRM